MDSVGIEVSKTKIISASTVEIGERLFKISLSLRYTFHNKFLIMFVLPGFNEKFGYSS